MPEEVPMCQQPPTEEGRAAVRQVCGTLVGLIGVTDSARAFSESEIRAFQTQQDPLGIARAQAGIHMLKALGRQDPRELIDGAVPPELRCPTCPLRDVCERPALPTEN